MIRKYGWVAALIAVAGLWFYLSRDQKKDTQTLVAAVVKENNASFRRQKMADCQASVLEKANAIADSMMLEMARLRILTQDSLIAPERPGKPLIPAVKSQLDTAKVKPLFDG